MPTEHPPEPCGSDCGDLADERNRFFTGKFMTARDFRDEQRYFLSRHRLHNRLLHGWGIVCGLQVKKHPRPECARRWVVVTAGIAVDCCGRELILPKAIAYRLPLPWPDEDADYAPEAAQEGTPPPAGPEEQEEPMPGPFLLCLRYREDQVERVPALYAEGTCDPKRQEANRVRERASLEPLSLEDAGPGCWLTSAGDPDAGCRDDCDDAAPGPAGTCLEPDCPCGECVPLALITFNPEDPGAGCTLDDTGRHELPTAPQLLTRIVHVNWQHGGEVTLEELQQGLVITFDRKLLPKPEDSDATGVSEFTFVVQYGGVQQDVEFLPPDPDQPPALDEERCRAVFVIDPDYITPRGRYNIVGSTVFVALKCDFILDCHNRPVDGNFLRGRLPTGDGIPGGTFESWFRVVRGHEPAEEQYRERETGEERPRSRREER